MGLHALTLVELVALIITFRSVQKRNNEMYKTFQLIQNMKREDNNGYLTPTEGEIRTKLRINSANGSSSSDDSGIVQDGGCVRNTRMPSNHPPDPPPSLHRSNTYLNPDEQQQNNKSDQKGNPYLDIIQSKDDIALKEINSGYEQLPSVKSDVEKPHNYEQLKKLFEQGEPNSNLNYEKLVAKRKASIKHDYNKLHEEKAALSEQN